jgi:hypothetical protein
MAGDAELKFYFPILTCKILNNEAILCLKETHLQIYFTVFS